MVINVAELSVGDLVEFARWMLDEGIIADDTDILLDYFEKPWNYEVEYEEYTKGKETENA